MLILGIDPSLTKTGLVLVRARLPRKETEGSEFLKPKDLQPVKVLDKLSVSLPGSKDIIRCCLILHDALTLIVRDARERYKREAILVYIEVPFHRLNASIFGKQWGLITVLQWELVRTHGIIAQFVNPTQVKSFLDIPKKKWSDKGEVVSRIREFIDDPTFMATAKKADREAICDAVGIALSGALLSCEI